jgi:flavorubredoxin
MMPDVPPLLLLLTAAAMRRGEGGAAGSGGGGGGAISVTASLFSVLKNRAAGRRRPWIGNFSG